METGIGGHQWIEYPGGSVGFWPGKDGIWPGGPGTILSPDPHNDDQDKKYGEVVIPDCADKNCFQNCIKNLKNSPPPFYCITGNNCRSWSYNNIDERTKKCNNGRLH